MSAEDLFIFLLRRLDWVNSLRSIVPRRRLSLKTLVVSLCLLSLHPLTWFWRHKRVRLIHFRQHLIIEKCVHFLLQQLILRGVLKSTKHQRLILHQNLVQKAPPKPLEIPTLLQLKGPLIIQFIQKLPAEVPHKRCRVADGLSHGLGLITKEKLQVSSSRHSSSQVVRLGRVTQLSMSLDLKAKPSCQVG